MKFLKSEHASLVKILEEEKINVRQILFVKKKGKVIVSSEKRNDVFVFFRKEETSLNAEKKWEKEISYSVNSIEYVGERQDWGSVLEKFRYWVKKV